jgi:hypothetical protein
LRLVDKLPVRRQYVRSRRRRLDGLQAQKSVKLRSSSEMKSDATSASDKAQIFRHLARSTAGDAPFVSGAISVAVLVAALT